MGASELAPVALPPPPGRSIFRGGLRGREQPLHELRLEPRDGQAALPQALLELLGALLPLPCMPKRLLT